VDKGKKKTPSTPGRKKRKEVGVVDQPEKGGKEKTPISSSASQSVKEKNRRDDRVICCKEKKQGNPRRLKREGAFRNKGGRKKNLYPRKEEIFHQYRAGVAQGERAVESGRERGFMEERGGLSPIWYNSKRKTVIQDRKEKEGNNRGADEGRKGRGEKRPSHFPFASPSVKELLPQFLVKGGGEETGKGCG